MKAYDRFFDRKNNRLVFINNKADSAFWDSHWEKMDVMKQIRSAALNRMIIVPTKKYLPKNSRILEGGCGLGQNVWSLSKNGYDAYGVDYAVDTVKKVNKAVPELNISVADLRRLEFKDDSFDGYWSLGVIEHFYNGFEEIAKEMKRVIKPGGYLFLTFPSMSKFRKRKAVLNEYKVWGDHPGLVKRFYQFALSSEKVEKQFCDMGFTPMERKSISGLKGFKDEINSRLLKKWLQHLYDSNALILRVMAWGLDQILSFYSGHGTLIIFKNIKE